jgi:hypothetical protein
MVIKTLTRQLLVLFVRCYALHFRNVMLKKWQESLGRGYFKRNYMAAGWTENEVYACFRALQNQQDAVDNCQPQVVDNLPQPAENTYEPLPVREPYQLPALTPTPMASRPEDGRREDRGFGIKAQAAGRAPLPW